MSLEPIQRRMSVPAVPTALNVPQFMTDDITTLTFIQLNRINTLLDMYNDPDPTARTFTNELFKNSVSTGRNFFSSSKKLVILRFWDDFGRNPICVKWKIEGSPTFPGEFFF